MQEHFIDNFGALQDWEQSMLLAALQRIVTLMDAKTIQAAPTLATGGPLAQTSEQAYKNKISFKDDSNEQTFIETDSHLKR